MNTAYGYGARNSIDWQLALDKLDLRFGPAGGPHVLDTIVFSDPFHKVSWQTVCDPTHGTPLPPLSLNALPATPPAACGSNPSARLLTGADFDPESIEIGKDGTFWIGGDGDFFRFPFNTIEAVHVLDDHTIVVANDNNYPLSNARSRSRTKERTGPLAPDDNEFILVKVSASLHPDRRLLPTG